MKSSKINGRIKEMILLNTMRHIVLGVIMAPFVVVVLGVIVFPLMLISFIGEFLVTGRVTESYQCFINTPKEWGLFPEN